jgi:hypothetical protein
MQQRRRVIGGPAPVERGFDAYCGELQNPDRGVATRAVDSIVGMGPLVVPKIFDKIDVLIKPGDERTAGRRHMAAADLIWAMVQIGDRSAVMDTRLHGYAGEGNETGVRRFAEWASRRLGGDEPSVEQASAELKSSGFFTPMFAALDLDLIGTKETVKPLLEACGDTREDRRFVRGTAAWGLGKHLGEAGVRDKLESVRITDPDNEVRQIAREALKGRLRQS